MDVIAKRYSVPVPWAERFEYFRSTVLFIGICCTFTLSPKQKNMFGIKITEEQFLSCELSNISVVYFGKKNECRCGCAGEYTSTSYDLAKQNHTDQTNDSLVKRRLGRAKNLIKNGAKVEYSDIYVDVEAGVNRVLTFYFDDVENTIVKKNILREI